MIQTATKKPITVDFVQYDGSNHLEIIAFTEGAAKYETAVGSSADGEGGRQSYSRLSILTKEGEMLISELDYVIKEPFPTEDRKFYPCKPKIFLSSYDIGIVKPVVLSELPDDSWFVRMKGSQSFFLHVSSRSPDNSYYFDYRWLSGYANAFICSEKRADYIVESYDNAEKVKVSEFLKQQGNATN